MPRFKSFWNRIANYFWIESQIESHRFKSKGLHSVWLKCDGAIRNGVLSARRILGKRSACLMKRRGWSAAPRPTVPAAPPVHFNRRMFMAQIESPKTVQVAICIQIAHDYCTLDDRWIRRWRRRLPDCEKAAGQCSQRYGLAPVCTRTCFVNVELSANARPHRPHT